MKLKNHIRLCVAFVLFSAIVCLKNDDFLDIEIFHQIGCEDLKFCPRGNITIKNVRSGIAMVEQDSLSPIALKELKELAEQDTYYILLLRVFSESNSVKGILELDEEFLTSMKAKSFIESGFQDVITIWFDNNGGVVGVGAQVGAPTNKTANKIGTKLYIRTLEQAPAPDTAAYIQKLEREREAQEKGELKDNRGFFAKYWMYIVPVAIFVMISGASNPEQGNAAAR